MSEILFTEISSHACTLRSTRASILQPDEHAFQRDWLAAHLMATVGLVWFRRDLRLADNPALHQALRDVDHVIPVFIHAPDEDGAWPPGAASRWWLHHGLTALEQQLRRKQSALIIRRGPSVVALRALIEDTGATAVYWNRLYDPTAQERDDHIERALQGRGIRVQTFNGALLSEPWEVSTGGRPYKVFTPYWKACLRRGPPADPVSRPRTLRPPPLWPEHGSLASLGLLPRVRWDGKLDAVWRPGEQSARARLRRFLTRKFSNYHADRDVPATAATSTLSPHLHFGELSARQVWHAVHTAAAASGRERQAEAYLRQLGWRDFGHHLLYHFPHTAVEPFRDEFAKFPWRRKHSAVYRAWTSGKTGVPLVDAGMRELWATGFMHNRTRMLVASFLCKNAMTHWLNGARWFWETLVDADLANNSLGWQWSAGCGADAAPFFRIFNPVRQGERFDPDGAYVKRWIPELGQLPARYLHAPWAAPADVLKWAGIDLGRDYPRPVLDLGRSRSDALETYRRFRGG